MFEFFVDYRKKGLFIKYKKHLNEFLLDREKISQEVYWDYRIISSDGTWSGNIFDFYFKIINKITDNLNVPFRTVNGIRQDDTRVHEAVREAVANALIHADYRLPRGIVIEKGRDLIKYYQLYLIYE